MTETASEETLKRDFDEAMGCGASKQAEDQLPPPSSAFFPPTPFMNNSNQEQPPTTALHHVRNVFANPLQVADDYRPPVHAKTAEQAKLIRAALKKNFVFEELSHREATPLVDAFQAFSVAQGETIIAQGDDGDYFYIIESGTCAFFVDDQKVGVAGKGNSFGELALLYTCPRAATVTSVSPMTLFRVDQTSFRFLLQRLTVAGSSEKRRLLQGIEFLKELEESQLRKLAEVLTPSRFKAKDVVVRKGDDADYFYVLQEGTVKVQDIEAGGITYQDITLQAGEYFGERALVTKEPRAANVIAETDGLAFRIDKETFQTVLGDFDDLILKSQDKRKLAAIKLIQDTPLEQASLTALAQAVTDKDFKAGDTIMIRGEPTEAALYLVRSGKLQVAKHSLFSFPDILERGGFLGVESLTADVGLNDVPMGPATVTARFTVTVLEDCTCGVLTLESCRQVIDTRLIGKGEPDAPSTEKIGKESLEYHKLLGAGTFGQVWLVTDTKEKGTSKTPYALKVQSKFELARHGQARGLMGEKKIMSKLHHPFIIRLLNTYQDTDYVYMLMDLVQGGEMFNVLHGDHKRRKGLPESSARFYAAAIFDALAYCHNKGIVYRDLKPENVLIDAQGYPKIVDFGFAKYVVEKTFTLCGTPLYIAPEVILNRGHNAGADHWSLGVMIYEMICGFTPFYSSGMDQAALFAAIVKGKFSFYGNLFTVRSYVRA